ncbi:RNA-directed DNA polymerase, eukaryota, reverse transcriptase zinc-binding domain protein [Tanacetum coccineum]
MDLNENCTIRDRVVAGNWTWQWKRSVTSGRTEDMLNSLLSKIKHLTLSFHSDSWKWSIGLDILFAVGFTRAYIDQLLLPSLNIATRWNTCLPRKVNIFICRMRLDRLPLRLNLSKRGLEIDSILCLICNNNVKSNNQVFFSCEVASSAWRLLRIWCNNSDLSMPLYTDLISWIDNMSGSNIKNDHNNNKNEIEEEEEDSEEQSSSGSPTAAGFVHLRWDCGGDWLWGWFDGVVVTVAGVGFGGESCVVGYTLK